MDHYTELVLAHAEGPGGKCWADGLELDVINDLHRREVLEIDLTGAPDGHDAHLVERWRAIRRNDDGTLLWQSECRECEGTGTVIANGRTKDLEIDCPWHDDDPFVEIVTDYEGVFVRIEPA